MSGRTAPPSGTVTFLFTDIENSTRLWDEHPVEMRVALERHDAILRSAILEHSGYVFSTAGDAFASAFPPVADAVDAAVSAQVALAQERWPAATPVRVRMGLHLGEAHERDGDYFGAALSRGARITSAGHGGQVLASNVVAQVLQDHRSARWSLRALGEVQLRGLGRPDHLYEVRYPEVVGDFPPLRVTAARRGRLPRVADDLIGRSTDLAAVLELVEGASIATLAGPGGVGKTRMAIEAGSELVDRLDDGVWFVALAPVADNRAVPPQSLRCWGCRSRPISR